MSTLTEDPILIISVQEISIMPSTQAVPEDAAEAVPAHVRVLVLVRVVAEPVAARRIPLAWQEHGVKRITLRKINSFLRKER